MYGLNPYGPYGIYLILLLANLIIFIVPNVCVLI